MASITVNLAPTIVSGTATVYARSDWAPTVAPSGSPPGSSVTTGSVGTDGNATFSGLTEGTAYVAYQSTPDRYVNFRVLNEPGTVNDPEVVESSSALMTAATYSAGLMATYTETRASDSKTRTITITRNGDGTIASQSATAWA